MVTKIALSVLLGALAGLVAAVGTRLDPAQVTLGNDTRAVVIVQAAWQGVCYER